jgi:quercetin dioxygenase-like cupin family protein
MPNYSSRDFGKTKREIAVCVPEKLIHTDVEKLSIDSEFSRERKHPVFVVDLPTKTMSMTIGHLASKERTGKHRHTYETVIYILEGMGRTFIEDKVVEWKAGDAVYVPVWAWHFHENQSDAFCRYVACENAPLLQNLGGIALREEA